jgi:6,7-dimethyl-8-ribityllumazine synthase
LIDLFDCKFIINIGLAMAKILEGNYDAKGRTFAIVVSRWNQFIVNKMLDGALDALKRHNADDSKITIGYCPGSFEIPLVVQKFAETGKFDAIIALGAVIRGSTPHFEYIASEVTKGIANVNLKTGIPCILGVLTTDTIEQAIERAGSKSGNKGFEAATSAIEMISLLNQVK